MDYLEKAKYELILGIKTEESSEIIEVLKQYYNDMVKLLLNDIYSIKEHTEKHAKYVLYVHNDEKNISSFFFTSEKNMKYFYDTIKDNNKIISFSSIEHIDPEDIYRPCENNFF